MATVKIYNEDPENNESGSWIPVASSSASEITVDNVLLKTKDGKANVEDTLLDHKKDIELLKKNVAWLALHGGGGYGGGGGSSSSSAKVSIVDMKDDEITQIVYSEGLSLRYRVTSRGNSTYTVTVKIGSQVIQTDTGVIKLRYYPIYLSKYGKIKEEVTLRVSAIDEGGNEYTASCKILISNITLTAVDRNPMLTTEQLGGINSSIIQLSYSVSIPGNYKLYFNPSNINQSGNQFYDSVTGQSLDSLGRFIDLGNVNTNSHTIGFSINHPADNIDPVIDPNSVPGTYPIQFVISNATDPSLFSKICLVSVSVVTTSTLLVIPLDGADPNNCISVTQGQTFSLRFKAVTLGNSGFWDYEVYSVETNTLIGSGEKSLNTEINLRFSTTQLGNEPGDYRIKIKGKWGTFTDEKFVYIRVVESSVQRLDAYLYDLLDNTIFDYTVEAINLGEFIQNRQPINNLTFKSSSNFSIPQTLNHINISGNGYLSSKSKFSFYDHGVDSKFLGTYISLNHRTYGIISNNDSNVNWFPQDVTDANSLTSSSDFQFTLDFAYSIKKSFSETTILKIGNYDPVDYENGEGICIKSSGYYIKFGGTVASGKLQDNTFTNLTITFKLEGKLGQEAREGTIIVYKNGIYDQKKKFYCNLNNFKNIKEIYVAAGKMRNGEIKEFTNLNLYSIRLFSKKLNMGQIVCSYINNYLCYDAVKKGTGEKSESLYNTLITNNKLRPDKDILNNLVNGQIDTSLISSLYNFKTGEFSINFVDPANGINVPAGFENIPIPIVILENLDWQFSDFTATTNNSSLKTNIPARFKYKTENTEIQSEVEVAAQGTSSMGYAIKNIDITFPEKTLFSPRSDWFPEKVFTLKADIVDSGHINNAVIGKFINSIYNSGSGLMNSSAFPMKTLINSFTNLPSSLTGKITVEGFPVLLIADFKKSNDGTTARDPRVLGIYSFNLGRKSEYNLGFKIPKGLYIGNDDVPQLPNYCPFPGIYYEPDSTKLDHTYGGLCYEGVSSLNSSSKIVEVPDDYVEGEGTPPAFDYYEVRVRKSQGNTSAKWVMFPKPGISKDESNYINYNGVYILDEDKNRITWNDSNIRKVKSLNTGYCWSGHYTYIDFWSIENDTLSQYYEASEISVDSIFLGLLKEIAYGMPYEKANLSLDFGAIVPEYKFDKDSGSTSESGETMAILRPNTQDFMKISIKNTAFYYVICMLFGLVDSFGKNMQLKYWRNVANPSVHSYWSPSFYDMDTALGLYNDGREIIEPTVLDYTIFNGPDNSIVQVAGSPTNGDLWNANELTTIYSNKLWGSIENSELPTLYQTDFTDAGPGEYKYYTYTWNRLRSTLIPDVDTFVDTYFVTQLKDCGEFLLNYDYEVKYINTLDYELLHGTRIDYIRNWLKERVVFLDSVFGLNAKLTDNDGLYSDYLNSTSLQTYETPFNNNFSLNSVGKTVTIVSKSTAIFRSLVNKDRGFSVYVRKNTPTEVVTNLPGGNANLPASINNSNLITDIDLHEKGLSKLTTGLGSYVKNIDGSDRYANYEGVIGYEILNQLGSLSSLKVFDISGNITLDEDIRLFNVFKTWDSSGTGVPPEDFALEEINFHKIMTNIPSTLTADLSGVNYSTVEEGLIPEVYNSPFRNLVKIDISESNVGSVNIPKDVSLMKLTINDSLVTTVKLEEQPLLSSLDFNGCHEITNVELRQCEKITSLKFNATNEHLKEVIVGSLPNLTSFEINGDNTYLPRIIIQRCPNLKTLTIKNCKLNDIDIIPTVSISCDSGYAENNHLSITLTNSDYTFLELDENTAKIIDKLILDKSKIESLGERVDNRIGHLNLSKFDTLRNTGNFSIKQCEKLEYIKFTDSITETPFNIVEDGCFSRCTNLTSIAGNIDIRAKNVFQGCSSLVFTYSLGLSPIDTDDDNIDDTDNYTYVTTLLGEGDDGFLGKPNRQIYTYIRLFGKDGDCSSMFASAPSNVNEGLSYSSGPKLNIIDLYYFLYNLGPDVTNISSMFSGVQWNTKFNSSHNPDRRMYQKCLGVNVSSLFYNSSPINGYTSYPSPTKVNNEYQNNGLLSYLRHSSINRYSGILENFACDKDVFRLSSGEFFTQSTLYVKPHSISNRDLTGFFSSFDRLSQLDTGSMGDISVDFDKICSGAEGNDGLGLGSTFTTFNRNFYNLTSKGTLVLKNLFKEEVRNSDNINLSSIYGSFIISYGYGGNNVNFILDEHTFDGLKKLTKIEAYDTTEHGNHNTVITTTPFSGSGLNKKVILEKKIPEDENFPYELPDILGTNNWTIVAGLLKSAVPYIREENLEEEVYSGSIELPGKVFKNKSTLTEVRAFFYDIQCNFVLIPEGFTGCSNLSNISYLFAKKTENKVSNIQEPIPLRFFYVAEEDKSKIIYGSDWENEIFVDSISQNETSATLINEETETTKKETIYTNFEVVDLTSRKIKISPITIYTIKTYEKNENDIFIETTSTSPVQVGLPEGQTPQVTQLSYKNYFSNIKNISYCFKSLNIPSYSRSGDYTNSEIEENEDYSPYRYLLNGSTWSINKNRDLSKYTLMWKYDGNLTNYLIYINSLEEPYKSQFQYLDEIILSKDDFSGDYNFDGNTYEFSRYGGNYGGIDLNSSPNFCIPPDLFRYFNSASSINLKGLFSNCGVQGPIGYWNTNYDINNAESIYKGYGLKGRLCPYLLKPIPNTMNLSSMFMYDKYIGYYTEKDGNNVVKSYLIPKTFFSYLKPGISSEMDLSYMFSETVLTSGTNLSHIIQFGNNSRISSLDVNHMFYNCIYQDPTISYVFTGFDGKIINIFNINYAFALPDTINSSLYPSAQKATFMWVFPRNTTSGTGKYVFAYFSRSSGTKHEPNPTVDTSRSGYNYLFRGETDSYNGWSSSNN